MTKTTIACAQIDCVLGAPATNRDKIIASMRSAAERGAQLVIFPECALTGYAFNSLEEAIPFAEKTDGPSSQAIAEACRETGTYAIVGFIEADGDKFYNAAMLVGPNGVVGSYRKVHLPFIGIDRFLTPGDRPFAVFDLPFGKDLVATYAALAIDCESQRLIESVDVTALMAIYQNVPLMRFRVARCGRPPLAAPLIALRAADPRWNDTLFWEARRAVTGSPQLGIDLTGAIQLYGEGRAAFPNSIAMTMAWANTNMSAEEFEAALSGFDHVLLTFPDHRDALSGRMQSLSYLMRHPDAIATATRILDLGTWHMAPLPLGPEVSLVNIQGEHSGGDTEERSFEEKFDTALEVIL